MNLGKQPFIQLIIHSTNTRIAIMHQVLYHRDGRLPEVINSEHAQRLPSQITEEHNQNPQSTKALNEAFGIHEDGKGVTKAFLSGRGRKGSWSG